MSDGGRPDHSKTWAIATVVSSTEVRLRRVRINNFSQTGAPFNVISATRSPICLGSIIPASYWLIVLSSALYGFSRLIKFAKSVLFIGVWSPESDCVQALELKGEPDAKSASLASR